jgi:hypothetical protein
VVASLSRAPKENGEKLSLSLWYKNEIGDRVDFIISSPKNGIV